MICIELKQIMTYDPEALKRMISDSGVGIAHISRETGLARSTIYHLQEPGNTRLTLDYILTIAKACKLDPRDYFPETHNMLNEPEIVYNKPDQQRRLMSLINSIDTKDVEIIEALKKEVQALLDERDSNKTKLLQIKQKLNFLR